MCTRLAEWCIEVDTFGSKLDFFVKSLIYLSCNMVTEAPLESNIQEKVLGLMTRSETLMSHLASVETDYSIIYPFLVFLYNSMARREELRVFFVTESPCHGLNTFLRIFCSLKEAESSDSSDESDKAKVQEWVTRLLVLLMTNYDGDLSSYEEDKVSLFEQLIMSFPREERSNVLYFYK